MCEYTAQMNINFFPFLFVFLLRIAIQTFNSLLHEFCITPLYTHCFTFHPIAESLWWIYVCKCEIIKPHINIDFGTHSRSIDAHFRFFLLAFLKTVSKKERNLFSFILACVETVLNIDIESTRARYTIQLGIALFQIRQATSRIPFNKM